MIIKIPVKRLATVPTGAAAGGTQYVESTGDVLSIVRPNGSSLISMGTLESSGFSITVADFEKAALALCPGLTRFAGPED